MQFDKHLCNISHGFNWHGALHGPSAIAELLVFATFLSLFFKLSVFTSEFNETNIAKTGFSFVNGITLFHWNWNRNPFRLWQIDHALKTMCLTCSTCRTALPHFKTLWNMKAEILLLNLTEIHMLHWKQISQIYRWPVFSPGALVKNGEKCYKADFFRIVTWYHVL